MGKVWTADEIAALTPTVDGVPDLRSHVRAEAALRRGVVLVRGGPDSAIKIVGHAARTARGYVLEGRPVSGISVFAALDDVGSASLGGLLSGRLSTYRVVHTVTAGAVVDAGFILLATFSRPHMTLLPVNSERAVDLLALFGSPEGVKPVETRSR